MGFSLKFMSFAPPLLVLPPHSYASSNTPVIFDQCKIHSYCCCSTLHSVKYLLPRYILAVVQDIRSLDMPRLAPCGWMWFWILLYVTWNRRLENNLREKQSVIHPKWIEGMKLGPKVHEKMWKSKSDNAPFGIAKLYVSIFYGLHEAKLSRDRQAHSIQTGCLIKIHGRSI